MPEPIYFWNGEQVGASPAQVKKTVRWTGNLERAWIEVNFSDDKLGWGLKTVRLNNKEYDMVKMAQTVGGSKNKQTLVVTDALVNGDNVLTLNYDYNGFTATFGDKATVTAALYISVVLALGIGPLPALPGFSIDIPSFDLIGENLQKSVQQATAPTLALLGIIAAIIIAIAYLSSRIPMGALAP